MRSAVPSWSHRRSSRAYATCSPWVSASGRFGVPWLPGPLDEETLVCQACEQARRLSPNRLQQLRYSRSRRLWFAPGPEVAVPTRWARACPLCRLFRITIASMEIHPSARKHGIVGEDLDTQLSTQCDRRSGRRTRLYLGPARSAALLEVVAIVRADGSELAIHAMLMRAKYQRLLPGG